MIDLTQAMKRLSELAKLNDFNAIIDELALVSIKRPKLPRKQKKAFIKQHGRQAYQQWKR